MVNERFRLVQRIQKALQDANVKTDSFITDLMGKSGRAFLAAIVSSVTDPHQLASIGDHRLKASREQLALALQGRVTDHHRFMIRTYLSLIDSLDSVILEE